MTITRQIWGVILIGCLALALRLPTAGRFMTVDEFNWMERSAVYWHELFYDHDIGGTFVSSHPGATLAWLSGAGIFWQEHRIDQQQTSANVGHFRRYATAPVVVAVSAMIAVITGLTISIFGLVPGVVAGVMLATEPYFVAMGQIVHLDMLLGLFMLAALLGLLRLHSTGQRKWVWFSGSMFGLALATKFVLAGWLIPFIVWPLLQAIIKKQGWQKIRQQLIRIIAIAVLALVVLIFLWPALIAQPDFQLGYITRDTGAVLTQEHVALSAGDDPIQPWTFYLRTFLARSSLLQLFFFAAAVVLLVKNYSAKNGKLAFLLLVYVIGFLIAITFAAKKADRYAVPALLALPLLAGWVVGVVRSSQFRWRKWLGSERQVGLAIIIAIGVIGIGSSWYWLPQAMAYNNPLFPDLRPRSQQGWGEGLEEAAAWLNNLPDNQKIRIAAWYPSVLQTYFNGITMSLSSRDDYRVSYVVTYRNMGGRAQDAQASDVLDEFRDQEPAHVVSIHGVPYVWIYRLNNVGEYIKHVGELVGSLEVGQTVVLDTDSWSSIDIGFATYSSRANTHNVQLAIFENLESTTPLRTVTVNARNIIDNEWQRFSFEPISNTRGKTFYVAITSPDSIAGDAVTVRYADTDINEGQMVLRRTAATSRQQSVRQGDIAYRLP